MLKSGTIHSLRGEEIIKSISRNALFRYLEIGNLYIVKETFKITDNGPETILEKDLLLQRNKTKIIALYEIGIEDST